MYERLLAIREKALGPDHPQVRAAKICRYSLTKFVFLR